MPGCTTRPPAGRSTASRPTAGSTATADALLIQPEIERLLLAGDGGRQGVLHSWSSQRRLALVDAGTGRLTAFAYDANGRLVTTTRGSGAFAVPVEPYGFTYLIGG